ncbi:hypothetical protein G210_3528 [Candida maltosa Xu316]|uniref:Uncharacterized protein n=1 Tax=Candida maltosa (strain Xu316) TaxID=1245528 RepID=M3JV12_CANMX|nr:hypothetical protein G210_3541 [Candida maltosa Xu316]EMG46229.1 hypothetical protein G210_3528 [Candida maltosa Xu316]
MAAQQSQTENKTKSSAKDNVYKLIGARGIIASACTVM